MSAPAAASAGILAGAAVLGVGHLAAAFIDPNASPFYALGAWMVDHTPRELKDAAIARFGTKDKLALFLSMAVVMTLAAAAAGLLERRRLGSPLLALGVIAAAAAALDRPAATAWFALPALLGGIAGILVLRLLFRPPRHDAEPASPTRRRFLTLSAGLGVVIVGAAVAGQWLGDRFHDVVADRDRFRVPVPRRTARPATDLRVPGLTEFVTPEDRFYRIDTALRLPALSSGDWRLRIHGMVDRVVELDMDDLRSRTAVAAMITLTCVSNEVGGDLAGTAVWTGYRLADLLAEAGVHPDADMLLSRSVDGFTAGTPVSAITDGRDALLAVGMNGRALPIAHGYPARLIVPGLYGYVSATKWVTDLELTRFDRARAYWTDRGWAPRAPIKTASRIDVPAAFADLPAGPVTVAGVAWAQRRGVDRVEVQVDDGPWRSADLGAEYSIDTWRQWSLRWEATPGTHTLRVRATDRTAATQTASRATPFPDGATGLHSRIVTIE